MTTDAIVLEDLEKFFPLALAGWRAFVQPFVKPTQPALRGISLQVRAGEVMALVGANGAGKSTLLRILATLLLPTRGYARVAGFDVVREGARVRSQLGFQIGSDAGFYARLTARENLCFFAALNHITGGEAAERIDGLADLLGLGDALERQVRTLSTGTVHRLGLARAILHRPAVLLLDEPTRSLDPMAAAQFRRFLAEELVRRQGATILFASHALAEVEQLAGRTAVLDGGRLLACDAPAAVTQSAGTTTFEKAVFKLAGREDPEAHS